MHKARRQKLKLHREGMERLPTLIFEKAVTRHGKNFHLVQVSTAEQPGGGIVKLMANLCTGQIAETWSKRDDPRVGE